jgi:hypothetical protein
MIINSSFLDFIEVCLIYFIILFYFNYFIAKFLKFFIKNLIGYDLWTYIDDSIRLCPNNSVYEINSNTYILDYEYLNISEMIYYHDNFLDPALELIYYFDIYHETKNREDDDHELYGLMSTYMVPLQYKYYILEHYWPADEKASIVSPNFYNFDDLNSEFKFIYNDYKILLPKYEQFLHTRELFYNEKLYESKFLQYYFFKLSRYFKSPLSYWLMLKNKNNFWKKEYRTFDLIEPSQELCRKKYMTWFLLKCKYDEAKFEYDVFCNLSPYEVFDSSYYDVFLSSNDNLIDLETRRHQYIENKDEYFFDFINSQNLINYYFNVNFFANYHKIRFYECDYDYDKPFDPFDYFFFLFVDRGLLMLGYLILFYYFCLSLFLFFVCYYCWYHHVYSFNFDLYIEYIRMLPQSKYYNNYQDYNLLIFNFNKTNISDFFYSQNIKIELERKCTRDRNKLFFL